MEWNEIHKSKKLDDMEDKITYQQKKALLLARVLDHKTLVVLLSGVLDAKTKNEAVELIKKLSDPSVVAEYLDRAFNLEDAGTMTAVMLTEFNNDNEED